MLCQYTLVQSAATYSWYCFPADAQTIATEALLLDAVTSKKQRPADVLAALSALEDLHKSRANVPGAHVCFSSL